MIFNEKGWFGSRHTGAKAYAINHTFTKHFCNKRLMLHFNPFFEIRTKGDCKGYRWDYKCVCTVYSTYTVYS